MVLLSLSSRSHATLTSMATFETTLSTLEDRFPLELLDKILEEAVNEAFKTLRIPTTYNARALCLVSKTLLPFG